VEGLAEEFDLMDVALAAVKLAHDASGSTADEEDIPQPQPPSPRGGKEGRGRDRSGKPAGGKPRRGPSGPTTRLFVGAGRAAHVRPQDLVGAITGESPLRGHEIGTIQIHDRFSLVEVPESSADMVVTALRRTTIKGKKPKIRREHARP
jgi:ATP-dependent RNA helicase DeaD